MRKGISILFFLLTFLGIPLLTQAQSPVGGFYRDISLQWNGINLIPNAGAQVTICSLGGIGNPCTPTIPIYSNAALTISQTNPITTGSDGSWSLYLAPGQYTYTVTGTGLNPQGPFIFTVLSPAGGLGFSSIGSGTNTTSALVVGSGASLGPAGSGTITATTSAALSAGAAITPSSIDGEKYVDGTHYPLTCAGISSAVTDALAVGGAASVKLSPGTYACASTLSISAGPITIGCMGATGQEQASPKPCVLNATAGLGANPIINVSSADGTTLNNLTFDNHGTATYGIFLQNTQYAWINYPTCINPNTTFSSAFMGTATAGQANYQIHVVNPNIQATGPVGIQIDRTNIFSISHGAFINHTTANITVGLTTADTQIVIDQGTDFGQASGGGATADGVKVGTVSGLKIKDAYCETAQSGAQTGQLCVQFVSAAQSTATLDSNYFAGNAISNYGMQLNGLINLTLSGVNAFSGFVTAGINNISNTSVIALGNNPVDTLNAVPVWDSLAGVAFRQDAATTSAPFAINTGLAETGTMFVSAIGTPSAPTLSGPGSSGGGTTYTYFCVAEDASGLKTLASAQGQTTTGLATLTGVNFIAVHCPGQAGAYAYDILKTDTAHRLARVVVQYAGFGPTFNDTGQATVGFTAAGRDQTGDLNVTGNITPSNNLQVVNGSVIFTEKGAPTGGANTDNCYGDSTAHAVKCSNNGGTFQQVDLISNTSTTTSQVLHASATAGVGTYSAIAPGDLPTCSTANNYVCNNAVNTGTAAMTLDMTAASTTAGLKLPNAAGAIPTTDAISAFNTTTHANVWGSNGTTIVGAAAAIGTNSSTTCTNQVFTVISATAAPTCTTLTTSFLPNIPLNQIISPTGAVATFADGNNPVTVNCAQTTDAQDCWTFGETSAATNGTLTNLLANQAELHAATASGSTATPLEVEQAGCTATTCAPLAQFESTWNNASLVGQGIVENVTNTNSAASSLLENLRVGNTTQWSIDKGGLATGAIVQMTTGTQIISGADYTNSTTTPSTVFSWTLPATASAKTYRYTCDIMWESTNTTLTGPQFGVNISAAPTQLTAANAAQNTLAGADINGYISNTTTGHQNVGVGTAAGATNTNYWAKMWGTIEGAPVAGSTFIIDAAALSNTTSTVNIRRGSGCTLN